MISPNLSFFNYSGSGWTPFTYWKASTWTRAAWSLVQYLPVLSLLNNHIIKYNIPYNYTISKNITLGINSSWIIVSHILVYFVSYVKISTFMNISYLWCFFVFFFHHKNSCFYRWWSPDDVAGEVLPLSQRQIWVIEEGQLLFQTAHAKGQVARWQDEENNTDKRDKDARIS